MFCGVPKRFLVAVVPKCPHISVLLKDEVCSNFCFSPKVNWGEFAKQEPGSIKKQTKKTPNICHLFGLKKNNLNMRRCHKTVMLLHPSGSQWTNRFFSVSSEVVGFFFFSSLVCKIRLLHFLFYSYGFEATLQHATHQRNFAVTCHSHIAKNKKNSCNKLHVSPTSVNISVALKWVIAELWRENK